MINRIFSSFEPSNFKILSIYIIPIAMITYVSMIDNKPLIIKIMIQTFIIKELRPTSKNKFFNLIITNLFTTSLIINLYSLTPISFTTNSIASVVIPTRLSLFLIVIALRTKNRITKILIHLTPISRPLVLSFFLVLVEFIRLIIRPITLSIRLISNMMAGHIMIHLLNKLATTTRIILPLAIVPSCVLLTAEIGICLIQAYIFFTLLRIYINE